MQKIALKKSLNSFKQTKPVNLSKSRAFSSFSPAKSFTAAKFTPKLNFFSQNRFVGKQNLSFKTQIRQFSGEKQDLVVIGGGPGGYVAAIKAGQLGMKVTCVEGRGKLGGTCLNVGCIPSKALLNISHKYHEATHNFAKQGIKTGPISIDVPTMLKEKEKAVNGLTSGIEGLFKKNKVTYAKGWGSLTGKNQVKVNGADGKESIIDTKNILIATGSDIAGLPGITIDEERIVSSTGALSLKEVPKEMIVIGGGVIGLELGSVWSRLGAKVTVVEFTDKIAAGADGGVQKEFQKILKRQGMEFKMKSKVTSAVRSGEKVDVTIEDAAGGNEQKVSADVVLVCVGRKPIVPDGLKELGVEIDKRGFIITDKQWGTSVPNIKAIGDCTLGPMLAHKAEEEGIAAVEEWVNPGSGHVNYKAIPSVIYTFPEVAWVGQTEEELKSNGIEYRVGSFPMKANSRARTNDEPDGLIKYLSDPKTDQILGAHMIAAQAGEMISEAVLAVEYGGSCEDIGRTCHAHPTLMEASKEAAMSAYSKPIHF